MFVQVILRVGCSPLLFNIMYVYPCFIDCKIASYSAIFLKEKVAYSIILLVCDSIFHILVSCNFVAKSFTYPKLSTKHLATYNQFSGA